MNPVEHGILCLYQVIHCYLTLFSILWLLCKKKKLTFFLFFASFDQSIIVLFCKILIHILWTKTFSKIYLLLLVKTPTKLFILSIRNSHLAFLHLILIWMRKCFFFLQPYLLLSEIFNGFSHRIATSGSLSNNVAQHYVPSSIGWLDDHKNPFVDYTTDLTFTCPIRYSVLSSSTNNVYSCNENFENFANLYYKIFILFLQITCKLHYMVLGMTFFQTFAPIELALELIWHIFY